MHSQKRGLLRPHSATSGWFGGPLPIFIMLALLIVGMYFVYSYNAQSNELEVFRHKAEVLYRNNRKLQDEATELKVKIEKLTGELSDANDAVEAKEKDCQSEMSKLRSDVQEGRDNFKKADDDAKDSQRTIEKLREQLTECRANTSALTEFEKKQEETIKRLNATILSHSTVAQTKTDGAVAEKVEEGKPVNQVGEKETAKNKDLEPETAAGDKAKDGTNEKDKETKEEVKVGFGESAGKNATTAQVGQQTDKKNDEQVDKQIDGNKQQPAVDGVKEMNKTATDAKPAGDVGAGGGFGADVALDKPDAAANDDAHPDGQADPMNPGDKDDVAKKMAPNNASIPLVDVDRLDDTLARSQNRSDSADGAVGRAPPQSKDQLDGGDEEEKDGQVKPPNVDHKSGDYQNDEGPMGTSPGRSKAAYSADRGEADKSFDAGKEDEGGDRGAVEFEDNEERINKQPVGRYNRLESAV